MISDFVAALRSLLRARGLTSIIVATIAIAVGVNTAIFSVIKAVWIDLLPFPQPHSIVVVSSAAAASPVAMRASWLDFSDWRAETQTLDQLSAYRQITLVSGEGDEAVRAGFVSPTLLGLLGASVVDGRLLTGIDEPVDSPLGILVTQEWQTRHASRDSRTVGRALRLLDPSASDRVLQPTVVGVLAAGFQLPDGTRPDILLPLRAEEELHACEGCLPRANRRLGVAGRLRAGATLSEARAEMETVGARLARAYPDSNKPFPRVMVQRARDAMLGESTRDTLFILQGLAGLIALVTGLNVAVLLLARTVEEERQISIRHALGATPGRIVTSRVIRLSLQAILGSLIGVGLVWLGNSLLVGLVPTTVPRREAIGLDRGVMAVAVMVCVGITFVCGLLPVTRDLELWKRSLAIGSETSERRSRWLSCLVGAQVAVSVATLLVAGLLGVTVRNLLHADAGFLKDGALVLFLKVPDSRADALARARLVRQEVQALPEMVAVGGVSVFPWGETPPTQGIADANSQLPPQQAPMVDVLQVTPGYFEAMGMRLLEGRAFNEGDLRADVSRSVVLNEAAAALAFPEGGAVGRQIKPQRTVVGVVASTRTRGLDQATSPAMYRLYNGGPLTIVARTGGTSLQALTALRQRSQELGIDRVVTMAQWTRLSIHQQQLRAVVAGTAGALVALLSAVGILAVTSYTTSRRRRECAVRLSVGATPSQVVAHVVTSSLVAVLSGAAIGLFLGLVAVQLLSSFLTSTLLDTVIIALASLAAVALISLASAYVPAKRIALVDPTELLRD